MPRAVRYKGDEWQRGACRTAQLTVCDLNEEFYQFYVLPFVVTANIICFSASAFVEYQINGLRMVSYVKPVTNVLSPSVNGQRLLLYYITDYERNKFFRVLTGAVVVGAV